MEWRYKPIRGTLLVHPKRLGDRRLACLMQSDIVLLYDERGIPDKGMNHIAWLGRQQAQSCLGGLR